VSGFPWLKLWNEAPDDPKWLAVADMAGSSRPIVFSAFAKCLTHANQNEVRGSITGLHPQVIASWCGVTLQEINRIFQAFRELGILIGDRIAKWAKRQSEKAAKRRSANAERVARHRQKIADQERQPEFDLTADARNAEALHSGVTVTAEEEGKAQRIPPSSLKTESLKEPLEGFEYDEGIPFGRDAPLEGSTANNVVPIARSPALKAKKKEMRRMKVARFINARYSGEDQRVRLEGMFGADEVHDEQWWFDKCDTEMKVANWDDVRDKAHNGWQQVV
jgi:hypothetical protein